MIAAAEAGRLGDPLARLLPWLAMVLLALGSRVLPAGRPRSLFLVLLATSPLLFLYAAEARAYAVLALADLALFLLVARGRPTPMRLAAAALLAAGALYLHYLAMFFVAALAIVLAARRRWSSLLALSAGGLLFLPWLPILRAQPEAATAWMREPLGDCVVGFLSCLGGAGRIPGPFGPPLPPWLFAGGIATGVLAIAARIARRQGPEDADDATTTVLLFLVGVLLGSLARPVAFAGRSELAVLPLWLWGLAAASDRDRLARLAGITLASVGALSTILLLSRVPGRPPGAALLDAARRAARPEDTLVAGGGFYLPARLEADRGEIAARLWSFPSDLERHPGWFRAAPPTARDYEWLTGRLEALPDGRRVLFLLQPPFLTPELSRLMASRGSVSLLDRKPGGLLFSWTAGPRVRP